MGAERERLVKTLPDSRQTAIATHEAEKSYTAADYQAAVNEFDGKYVWRRPVQAELDSVMATVNEGIYTYMQDPSEFTIAGTLEQYNATPFLKDVKVAVLFTVGEFDEGDPPTVKRHAQMTPGAKYAVIPNAAHLVEQNNPDETNRVVRDFLKAVDSTTRKP